MINYASNRAGVHMFLAAVVAVAACRGDTRAAARPEHTGRRRAEVHSHNGHPRVYRRADAINFRDEGTLAGADGEIDERFLWDLPRTSSLSTLKLEALLT
jgi:hypothetical protein